MDEGVEFFGKVFFFFFVNWLEIWLFVVVYLKLMGLFVSPHGLIFFEISILGCLAASILVWDFGFCSVLIAGLGNGGRESCGVVAHDGEWVLVVFLITSSSLKPIALSQFDVGQYASTLGLDLSHSGLVRSWSSLGSSLPSSWYSLTRLTQAHDLSRLVMLGICRSLVWEFRDLGIEDFRRMRAGVFFFHR